MPKTDLVLIVRQGQPQTLAHQTISREEARALKKAGQGYFADSGRVLILMGKLAEAEIEEIISYAAHELASSATLSDADVLANVGLSKPGHSELREGAIKRAQAKVKAWMSKETEDQRSPLPRGSWINPDAIQVSVVQ